MEEKDILAFIGVIIIVIFIIGIMFMYYISSSFPDLESVRIEYDYDSGVHLNLSKFNLSEDAIENISSSKFLIIVDFPEFNKKITYSFTPEFTNINHSIDPDQGSILIDNIDKYESLKRYPFEIRFQIESNNSELRNLILLRETNTINGKISFDTGSFDVNFYNGEYLLPYWDQRILEFQYPPNDIYIKFDVTKYGNGHVV